MKITIRVYANEQINKPLVELSACARRFDVVKNQNNHFLILGNFPFRFKIRFKGCSNTLRSAVMPCLNKQNK